MKAKLATILRHWADRLSPVPAAVTTSYVSFGAGDGVVRYATTTAAPKIADNRFDSGTEWAYP